MMGGVSGGRRGSLRHARSRRDRGALFDRIDRSRAVDEGRRRRRADDAHLDAAALDERGRVRDGVGGGERECGHCRGTRAIESDDGRRGAASDGLLASSGRDVSEFLFAFVIPLRIRADDEPSPASRSRFIALGRRHLSHERARTRRRPQRPRLVRFARLAGVVEPRRESSTRDDDRASRRRRGHGERGRRPELRREVDARVRG